MAPLVVRTPIRRRGAAGRTALIQEGIATRDRATAASDDLLPSGSDSRYVTPSHHRILIATAIAVDLAAVAIAFACSGLVRFTPERLLMAALSPSGAALLLLGSGLWVAFLSAHQAYAPRALISISGQLLRVLGAALPAWVLTHFLAFLLKATVPFDSRLAVGMSLPATLILLAAARIAIVRPLARKTYRRLAGGPILVLGDTERAAHVVSELERDPRRSQAVRMLPLAEALPDPIRELVEREACSEVVIEPDGRPLEEVFDIAFACLDAQAEVLVVSNQFHVVTGRASIHDVDGIPAMRFRRSDFGGPEAAVKRFVDLAGAGLGVVMLAPVLLAIAAAVKISSRGPIFFRQERVGRYGRRFTMYKFRTMAQGNDPSAHREYLKAYIRDGAAAEVRADGARIYKLTQDPRVTAVGSWLRSFSLDELPQLWNVLKGDMSLVGPRPCLPYEWELYRPWQRRRLDVLPGCTGLWQVTARSHVTFEEMVILDLHYAHHASVGRDLRLIAQTIPAMVRGRGGY